MRNERQELARELECFGAEIVRVFRREFDDLELIWNGLGLLDGFEFGDGWVV